MSVRLSTVVAVLSFIDILSGILFRCKDKGMHQESGGDGYVVREADSQPSCLSLDHGIHRHISVVFFLTDV